MKSIAINPTATLATAASILNALETVKGIAAVLEQQAAEAAAREEKERQKELRRQKRERRKAEFIAKQNDAERKAFIKAQHERFEVYQTDLIVKTIKGHPTNYVHIMDGKRCAVFKARNGATRLTLSDLSAIHTMNGGAYGLADREHPENGLKETLFSARWSTEEGMKKDLRYATLFVNRCIETVDLVFSDTEIVKDAQNCRVYLIPEDDAFEKHNEAINEYDISRGWEPEYKVKKRR